MAEDVLKLLQEANEPLSPLSLLCQRMQWIQVGDQVLLSSAEANRLWAAQNQQEATALLRRVGAEAREAYQVYKARQAEAQEKQKRREQQKQKRIEGVKLPEREVTRPGYRKVINPPGALYGALGSGAFAPGGQLDLIRRTYASLTNDPYGIAKQIERFSLEGATRPSYLGTMLDSITSTPSFRLLAKSFNDSLSDQLYSPPIYEDVPSVTELHPFWAARDEVEGLASVIPVHIWQATETETQLRGRAVDGPESSLVMREIGRERKVLDRALRALVLQGKVSFTGTRKNKRYVLVR